jgi:hypothetical protein
MKYPALNTPVLLWPDTFQRGISHFSDEPHLDKRGVPFTPLTGDFIPFPEALEMEHPTDAHCVFYCVEEEGELVATPVLRKACYYAAKDAGGRVVVNGFGFDFDTEGHVELTGDLLLGMLEKIEAAWDGNPVLAQWAAWYTTRKGLRVMYLLDEPMDALESERYWIALHNMYKEAGTNPDHTPDWTRRFRLPCVVRDHIKTSTEALYTLAFQEKRLSLDEVSPANRKSLARLKTFTPSDTYPDQEECEKRLFIKSEGAGRRTRTRFHATARKLLKNTHVYDMLFEEGVLPDDDRHTWLMQVFGFVVPKLLKGANASCEDVFALFYLPLTQWDPQSCDEDPHAHAWTCLNHVYGIEVQNYNIQAEDEAERVRDGENTMTRMIEGMRVWSEAPEIQESKPFDEQSRYLMGCLFANVDRYYYPMNPLGRYENCPFQSHQIIPFLRHNGLAALLPDLEPDEDGKSLSEKEIINRHSIVVQRVRAKPQQGEGGYITGMERWNPELVLPMYRRNPRLKARRDEQVDGWLRALFGKSYDKAAAWIGYALDFEAGAICALSLAGKPGAGKKLLTTGLGECLERPRVASGDALADKFNDILLDTPFLVVNERWPAANTKSTSPSDRFKELTAGDTLEVRPLYKSIISIENPLRVILTANNHDLLKSLVRGREQTLYDREALGERILHVDIEDAGRDYLWKIGGHGTTSRDGNRWIRGDGSQESDYIVARHFLWLYENRPERDMRQRFCVMGNCGSDSAEMFRMATQSDDMPVVMRSVVAILNNESTFGMGRMALMEGVPAFTMDSIYETATKTLEMKISSTALENCIEALSVDGHPVDVNGVHMWRLSLDMIGGYARKWGLKSDRLQELIRETGKAGE